MVADILLAETVYTAMAETDFVRSCWLAAFPVALHATGYLKIVVADVVVAAEVCHAE